MDCLKPMSDLRLAIVPVKEIYTEFYNTYIKPVSVFAIFLFMLTIIKYYYYIMSSNHVLMNMTIV